MAEVAFNTTPLQRTLGWLQPHRIVLIAVALAILVWIPFAPGGIAPFGWEFVLMLAPPLLIAMTFTD